MKEEKQKRIMKRRRVTRSKILLDSGEDVLLQLKDLQTSLIDFKLIKYKIGVKYNEFTFIHSLDIDDSQY